MRKWWDRFRGEGGGDFLVDTFTYGLAKVVPGLLGLASVVVLLQLAGETEYGRFALATAAINVWVTFSGGWFYQGVLRFGGELSAARLHTLLRQGVGLALGLFVFTGTLHLGFAMRDIGVVLAGTVLGWFSIAQATQLAAWQATLRPRTVLLAEVVRSIACFGIAVALCLIWRRTADALLWGTALGYLASVALMGSNQNTRITSGGAAEQASRGLPDIVRFGWPLSLWLAAQLTLPLIDRTLLANQVGLAETGKYAALSDILTRCFSLAVFPIVQAVYPRLARLVINGHLSAEAWRLLGKALLLLSVLGAAALPFAHVFRASVVRFALPTFDATYLPLVLPLSTAGFVWQAAMLAHKPLELAQRTSVMLGAMVVAVAIKAILTIMLVARIGVLGAAIATLAAGVFYCVACALAARSSR